MNLPIAWRNLKIPCTLFMPVMGYLTGLMAPLAYFLIRISQIDKSEPGWFQLELFNRAFEYQYLFVFAPLIFAWFGYFAGAIMEGSISFGAEKKRERAIPRPQEDFSNQLTGLFDRKPIAAVIDREIHRAARYGRPLSGVSIVFATDALATARAVVRSIRDIDIAGRIRENQLLVLLPEASAEGARIVADRIRARIEPHGGTVPGGVSRGPVGIGIFSFSNPATVKRDDLIREANRALRQP